MPIYKQKYGGETPVRPCELSGIWETNGAETTFFIPFPSVCAPLTHPTQQGTHVMHHVVISDSEVEVITLGSPFPLLFPRTSQRLDALMSAIDLAAWDNSFHQRDTPWWTGVPWTPRLIPGPVLRHAPVREAAFRTLGESIDLPRMDSQGSAGAVLFWQLLYFSAGPRHIRTQLHAPIFQIVTYSQCKLTVYEVELCVTSHFNIVYWLSILIKWN